MSKTCEVCTCTYVCGTAVEYILCGNGGVVLCGPTTFSPPHFPFVQCTSGGRKGVWLHEAKGGVAQQWNIGQVN